MNFVPKHIFRAYDIRGLAMGDTIEITVEVAREIGKAVGTFFLRRERSMLACGRDGRLTSEDLQKAFIEGVLSTGLSVVNLGFTTSPMIYYAVCNDRFDCGVNITASHNPKEYNGFKVVDNYAGSVCGAELEELYEMIENQAYAVGNGKYETGTIIDEYTAKLHRLVDIQKPLKVVVDSGNGVTGPFIRQVFAMSNVEVYSLYTEIDGEFPNHEANPEKAENLIELSEKVRELSADIGVGFDGDGDRVGFVDENGKHYSCDLILMLLARDALSRYPGKKVVFDVKCSKLVENDIKEHGGVPFRTKTGHSHIESAMHEQEAIIGGEISGHMFFNEDYYGFDDAFLGALKMLGILSRSDARFSSFFEGLHPIFNTPEIRLECPDSEKFGLIAEVTKAFQDKGLKVLTIDGAMVELDEWTWGAIRASNTAPQLTLRFESDTVVNLNNVIDIFCGVLSEFKQVKAEVILEYKQN
jgi:phosphomannomutase/phosphoglucomutase